MMFFLNHGYRVIAHDRRGRWTSDRYLRVFSRRCCVCPGISLDLAGPNEAVRHQYSQ